MYVQFTSCVYWGETQFFTVFKSWISSLHVFWAQDLLFFQKQFIRKIVSYNSVKLVKKFEPIKRFGVLIFSNYIANKDYFFRKIHQKVFYGYICWTKSYSASAFFTSISTNSMKNTMLNCEEFVFTLLRYIFLWGIFYSILVTYAEHFF